MPFGYGWQEEKKKKRKRERERESESKEGHIRNAYQQEIANVKLHPSSSLLNLILTLKALYNDS